jgi:asparagine N-glycosylation enzyme membrane subunit Stt3
MFENNIKERKEEPENDLTSSRRGEILGSDEIIRIRKKKIISFFRKKASWISYLFLAIITFMSVKIRTKNLPGLRDITTEGWTLGPDLDPFLFLRWAKSIVEQGTLVAMDMFRYVPRGYSTKAELILHPYMIAWFHKIAVLFGSESVEQSAAIYPVFFFAITVIAFFLFVRKLFTGSLGVAKSNVIALIASFFLSVFPVLLPRTIAGIPEKESAAFFFLFMAFYFFLSSWNCNKIYRSKVFAILAGVFTAGMALVWGGFIYIFVTISMATLAAFIFGKVNKNKIWIYVLWIASASVLMGLFSTRYPLGNIVRSLTTGLAFLVLFVILFDRVFWGRGLKKYAYSLSSKTKIPDKALSLVVGLILILVLVSVFFGPGFVFDKFSDVSRTLVKPVTDRLGVTVAENRQPYFGEWAGNFGPIVKSTPIFFWLFFIGSLYLFLDLIKVFKKKEKFFLFSCYLIFLLAIIFSRYKQNSILNGENFVSIGLYVLGALLFLISLGYYYYKYSKSGDSGKFRLLDFNLIFVFVFFFFGIISARGSVRTIMLLVPSSSIIVSYFVVKFSGNLKIKNKKDIGAIKAILSGIVILLVAFSGYSLYGVSNNNAAGFVPSGYNQQWQGAMSWTRDNTSEDSVFSHWWDYGYWIQSIGERATVLDGGNSIPYWNYLMGRHVLTGTSNSKALEFLYSHEATHLLIDSTDIGKYTAFSSIGSNQEYDRRSWIQFFLKDPSQTSEKKSSSVYSYFGNFALDGDIIYEAEGQKVFLPGVENKQLNKAGNIAGLGAITIEFNNDGEVLQPIGIFVYQNQRYDLPLRYVYFNGEFKDFGSGVEAGAVVLSRLDQSSYDANGAIMYLSERVVKSQLARLYLYGEENEFFKEVHVEDDAIVKQVKAQDLSDEDFTYFGGLRGPIKIWEVSYPSGIELNEEFLQTQFPEGLFSG